MKWTKTRSSSLG